jgi:acyl-CoA reductase-like NAD-dependent aldehyde dehydrogenase
MGILDDLLGNEQLQKQYRDFVKRYEQGDPSEGYSDQEVLKRYGEVSHAVPPDQYARAAQEALGKLSPEERAAFVKMLQERAAARGMPLSRAVQSEPTELGQILANLHQRPGQLRDMLGGGDVQSRGQAPESSPIGAMLASPMAKAVLAGIAAMVVKRVVGRQ